MASLGNLFFKIGADVSEATKGIKEVKGQLESIKKIAGFSAIIQGANAAIGVLNSVVGAVRPLVEEFDKSAKAAARLQTALQGNVAGTRELIQQASKLATTRLFPSDVTVGAQSMLASMGLTKDRIKELIPLIQDFATATGQDLGTATKLVGQAVVNGSDSLKKYGITVKDTANESERFTSVSKELTKTFGGQAEAAARVGAGPLQLLVQRFGEVKEAAGEALVKFATELLPDANQGVDSLNGLMKDMVGIAGDIGKAVSTALVPFKKLFEYYAFLQKITRRLTPWNDNPDDDVEPFGGGGGGAWGDDGSGGGRTPGGRQKAKTELQETVTLMEILTKAQGELLKSTTELDVTTEAYADAINDLKSIQQQLYDLEQKRLAVLKAINREQFSVSKLPTEGVKEVKSIKEKAGISAKLPSVNEQTKEVIELKDVLSEVENIFTGIGEAGAEAFGQIAAQLITGQLAFRDLGKAALQAARQIVQAALAEALAGVIAGSIKKFGLLGIGIAVAGLALVSALFRSKVPKLAKGGLAYGPQLAIVGDNPNASRDPEVISPLSKLKDMLTAEMYKMTGMMATAMDAALSRASVDVPTINQDAIQSAGPQEIIIKGQIDGSVIRLAYDRSASTQSKFQPNYY